MKIQKKYQGAIPLNRIANEHNESELNTYSTLYLNSKFCAISSTQPINGEEVWIQQGKNLFNLNALYMENARATITINDNGFSYEMNGTYSGEGFSVYVPELEKGKTYSLYIGTSDGVVVSAGVRLIKDPLDPDNNYHGFTRLDDNHYRVVANGYKYCRFWVKTSGSGGIDQGSLVNIQLEEGEEFTDYEPFVERNVFIKDGEGYKKFSEDFFKEPHLDIYSESEKIIGKWIDGKPLYRKVIKITGEFVEGNNTYPHNISYIGRVIRKEIVNASGTMIPYITLNEVASLHQITNTHIVIKCEGGTWGSATRYVILEYTKTTD